MYTNICVYIYICIYIHYIRRRLTGQNMPADVFQTIVNNVFNNCGNYISQNAANFIWAISVQDGDLKHWLLSCPSPCGIMVACVFRIRYWWRQWPGSGCMTWRLYLGGLVLPGSGPDPLHRRCGGFLRWRSAPHVLRARASPAWRGLVCGALVQWW